MCTEMQLFPFQEHLTWLEVQALSGLAGRSVEWIWGTPGPPGRDFCKWQVEVAFQVWLGWQPGAGEGGIQAEGTVGRVEEHEVCLGLVGSVLTGQRQNEECAL